MMETGRVVRNMAKDPISTPAEEDMMERYAILRYCEFIKYSVPRCHC
jgi:hypothetical protein